MLREADLHLPKKGWGRIDHPHPARTGAAAARPHQAVRHHPRRADLPDNPRGLLQDSGHNEVWTEARKNALTPALQRSPLGWRPFDRRHAAVPLWCVTLSRFGPSCCGVHGRIADGRGCRLDGR